MLLVARRAGEAYQSCYLAPCCVLLLPAAAHSPSAWWCMEVISTWPEPSCRSLISSSLLWWLATGAMSLQPRTRLSGIVSRHHRWMDGPKTSWTHIFWLNVPHCAQSQVKKEIPRWVWKSLTGLNIALTSTSSNTFEMNRKWRTVSHILGVELH